MGRATIIATAADAAALAGRLNGHARKRPVVVVTTPAGRAEPWIDADEIVNEVGDLAEVFVMTTGDHTREFSHRLPELTQVYGGAGRVYPPGHAWVADPRAESPLRFAFDEAEGRRATRSLVSDTLRMAVSAGLLASRASRHRRQVTGVVEAIVGERALVRVDRDLASIAQQLTVPDVPLYRVLAKGLSVHGWLDSETKRLDITESLLSPDEALASYVPGSVVLSRVEAVEADTATLQLHPAVSVAVTRDDVTSNDRDDLRGLMTAGEVLAARIVSAGPAWALTLFDVDDDDEPLAASSLVAGGPAWLEPPPLTGWTPPPSYDEPPELTLVPDVTVASPTPVEEPAASPPPETRAPAPPRPSPMMLDPKRRTEAFKAAAAPPTPSAAEPVAVPPATAGRPAARALVHSLEATVAAQKAELARLQGLQAELVLLRRRVREDSGKISHLESQLVHQTARVRKAGNRSRAVPHAAPAFADSEAGFRFAVTTAWATRTPVAEQTERPLRAYVLGPDFLSSLDDLAGISVEKVADVVFEIATDRVAGLPGRELHQLRESGSGNAPHVRRDGDRATCWRVSLQVHAPSARRLHFWEVPGGLIELSRVCLHDDFLP